MLTNKEFYYYNIIIIVRTMYAQLLLITDIIQLICPSCFCDKYIDRTT